jgi:MFS family permease
MRAVVRSAALRRAMSSFLLFNTVEYASWVAILLYAYDATGPASVGVVGVIQLLPSALFAAVAATIADRYPRQRVLLAGYLLQAAALTLTAVAMLAGAHWVVVYALATSAACVLTMTRPTLGALLPSLARTPEELTAANGLAGAIGGAGALIGPLAAALILVSASSAGVFAACGLAMLVAGLLVLRLPMPGSVTGSQAGIAAHEEPHDHDRPDARVLAPDGADAPAPVAADAAHQVASPTSRIVHGLHTLRHHPDAALLVALLSVRMLVLGAMDVLYVLLALEVLGTGESGVGVLNAAMGLGTVVGGAITFGMVGRRRLSPVLAGSAVAVGAALVLLAGTSAVAGAALLLAVAGLGCAVFDVAGRTMLQRASNDRVLARLLGALEGIDMLGIAVGSLLVPIIAAIAGLQVAIVAIGLVMPVAIAAAWLRLRHIDAMADVRVRELDLLRANAILSLLPPPQLEAVARRTRWIAAEPGDVLIREGDPGDRYYVLASGSWRITSGTTVLRDHEMPGEGVGEIALLRDVPRTATVTARTTVVAISLERADFLRAVSGHEPARESGARIVDGYASPVAPG